MSLFFEKKISKSIKDGDLKKWTLQIWLQKYYMTSKILKSNVEKGNGRKCYWNIHGLKATSVPYADILNIQIYAQI